MLGTLWPRALWFKNTIDPSVLVSNLASPRPPGPPHLTFNLEGLVCEVWAPRIAIEPI